MLPDFQYLCNVRFHINNVLIMRDLVLAGSFKSPSFDPLEYVGTMVRNFLQNIFSIFSKKESMAMNGKGMLLAPRRKFAHPLSPYGVLCGTLSASLSVIIYCAQNLKAFPCHQGVTKVHTLE